MADFGDFVRLTPRAGFVTSTNYTSSLAHSKMLSAKVTVCLVCLGGAWSIPIHDENALESTADFKDLSFVESLLDFASSSYQWDAAEDINQEMDAVEDDEPEGGSSDEVEIPEAPTAPEISIDDTESANADAQYHHDEDPPNPETSELSEEEEHNIDGLNNTVHGTDFRVETGLFFDVSKGGDDSCDDYSESDDDCDDDERGLLKKILFFLPASVQSGANSTKPASSIVPSANEPLNATVSVSHNVTKNETSFAPTRSARPNLDDIYRMMDSLAPSLSINWLAVLLYLI